MRLNRSGYSYAFALSVGTTLMTSLLACGDVEDDVDPYQSTKHSELDAVHADLDCYVGPKQAGKAPCPIVAKPCISAMTERVVEVLRAEGLPPESAEDMGPARDDGFYQYVNATHGMVGVYCHPQRTRARAYVVYGAIHEFWRQHGYEGWVEARYPISDEHDANGSCAERGALRQQEFEPVPVDNLPGFTRLRSFLCWSPESGVWLEKVPD